MRKIYFILFALMFITCKSQSKIAELPVNIIEPEFEIISIYVIQADIVVTEFEAVLKITNPNDFSSVLSLIKYELYGNNFHWAEGVVKDILNIPAKSSCEINFLFSMNFINTNRKLLDDVIAMRQIKYHFKGQADIQFDISKTTNYVVNFNCSGFSDVKKKSD